MGGPEFKSRSLQLRLETELHEERGLSGCRKGLKTILLAQALLSLKPSKTNKKQHLVYKSHMFTLIFTAIMASKCVDVVPAFQKCVDTTPTPLSTKFLHKKCVDTIPTYGFVDSIPTYVST